MNANLAGAYCFAELLNKLATMNEEAQASKSDSEDLKGNEEVRKRKGSFGRNESSENKENIPADYTPEQVTAVKR